MNRTCQLFDRALKLEHRSHLGNQFRRMGSDNVYAENFVVFRLGNNLDEARRVIDNLGLPNSAKRKLTHFEFVASFLGLCFVMPRLATSGLEYVQLGTWL